MTESVHAYTARILYGSPLLRRRNAILLVGGLILLLLFTTAMILMTLGVLAPDALAVFGRALLLSTAASMVPLLILRWLDRREPESLWMFAIAFLWGGLIATGLALPFNNAILTSISLFTASNPVVTDFLGPDAAILIGAPVAGPLVEEITKGLGVVLLFVLFRAEFDNVRDGFVYGALVGAGFNWLEAPLYVAQGYAQFGVAPFGLQLGGRYALFGLAGHALYTGLFGACLGLTRQSSDRWLKRSAPVVGLMLAIAGHFVNNSLGLLITILVRLNGEPLAEPGAPPQIDLFTAWLQASIRDIFIFFPYLVIAVILIYLGGHWERRAIREELATEAESTITAQEEAQIAAAGILRSRRYRWMGKRASARLVRAQNELAFRKHRLRESGADPDTDALVVDWRETIRALRADA